MSTQSGDLRLLLQLMEGTLPPADRATLRERFASDRELRQRWEYLNNLPPLTAADAMQAEQIPIAQVAAYIDGTLPSDTATQFETRSWNSPAMLAELVSMTQSNGVTAPDGLTTRLTSLMPAPSVESTDEPLTGLDTDEISATSSATVSIESRPDADRPVIVPSADPTPHRANKRRNRTSNATILAVMAVACVAVLGWLVWFASDRSNRQIVQPEPAPKSQQEPLAPQDPPQKLVDDQQQQPAQKDNDDPRPDMVPVPKDATPPSLNPNEPKVVDVPKSNQPEPKEPLTPPADTNVPPIKTIDWTEMNGLVAARLSVRDTWRGLKARDVPVSAHYATFPGTRAIAAVPGGIELVADQQSEFSDLAWDDGIQVCVTRGRVAFRNVPDDTRVRFLLEDETFEAVARRAGTTISFNLRWGEPRIGVHKGAAVVNKQKLEKETVYLVNQQRRTSIRNKDQFNGWLGTFQASVPIDAQLLAELRDSNDIKTKLAEATRAKRMSQPFSDRMTFVVAPQTRVQRLLLSRSKADHTTAIRWLLLQGKGSGSHAAAWANIGRTLIRQNMSVSSQSQKQAEGTARRQYARMQRWLEAYRTGTTIDDTEIRSAKAAMKPRLIQNFVAAFQTLQDGR